MCGSVVAQGIPVAGPENEANDVFTLPRVFHAEPKMLLSSALTFPGKTDT